MSQISIKYLQRCLDTDFKQRKNTFFKKTLRMKQFSKIEFSIFH